MPRIESALDLGSATYAQNRAGALKLLEQVRALEQRVRDASASSKPLFDKRGQLLPRERLARLLDAGAPYLELSTLAGYCLDNPDPDKSIPGGGVITGIGHVSGVRCMVVVSDSGIMAGAIQAIGLPKVLRAQRVALENKLPFIYLVESAGANLLKYRVEDFINGGSLFFNMAKLSAAGIPVLTVVHGSSTAGGAYVPGMSDYVVMVRGKSRAFLAGPPLLKAATGEIATDEELGGADMHASVSGLAEYVAEDDNDGVRCARDVMATLDWNRDFPAAAPNNFQPPRFGTEELAGMLPIDYRKPVDMRDVIARIVDDSDFLDFKAAYGAPTLCGHARIEGYAVGILSNNGPLDPAGATKATHFIQLCCQSGTPLVYLQNTTGFIVGKEFERGGMIKHGAKMIQAVSNATVPQITIMAGASFGAGNYGMCGRAFQPRFCFAWPSARIGVMGAEQAAITMSIVSEAKHKRKGQEVSQEQLAELRQKIVETYDQQASALYLSSLLLDDGIIDPRDTRKVLAYTLSICREEGLRKVRPVQFGVARP